MFGKKECSRCGNKVGKKDNFCSKCGADTSMNSKKENSSNLGSPDSPLPMEKQNSQDNPMPGFGGKMLNNILGNAIKMLEKEMQKEMKDIDKNKMNNQNPNFKLKINGKEVDFNQAKKKSPQPKKEIKRNHEFSDEQAKKFAKLKKEKPEADLKRLGNKIVYEINMPDVKSDKDVVIHNLESSIEVKALGKSKAYSKAIPIKMPITDKRLSEGKLVLEMDDSGQQSE